VERHNCKLLLRSTSSSAHSCTSVSYRVNRPGRPIEEEVGMPDKEYSEQYGSLPRSEDGLMAQLRAEADRELSRESASWRRRRPLRQSERRRFVRSQELGGRLRGSA
jgi:hypothetical protein